MNKILNVGVAALTVAGSILAMAAPVAAQGRAMGGGHAMGPGGPGVTSGAQRGGARGVVNPGGPRLGGGDRDGSWRGDRDGGWRRGYPYGYGWGPAFAGLAIGAAIGGAYAYGPGYYGYPYGGCQVWSPYYGRYVIRPC